MLRILPVLLLLLIGCASRKGALRADANNGRGDAASDGAADPNIDFVPTGLAVMPDDSALIAVRRLEADPLADDAALLRRRLFEWLLASERLHGFDASTTPIDDLQRTGYPYKTEMLLQFLFGGAAWGLGPEAKPGDLAAQQEAGIRSMIAAYRNIVQLDPQQRESFLDRLDELRRTGDLRRYIERKHRGERQ